MPASFADMVPEDVVHVTDNVVAVAQLREKIMSLERQLKVKNGELLKKEIKV